MTTHLPPLPDAYLQATNSHDAAAFLSLFAEDAVVDDVGRTLRTRAEIKQWSEREIFAADVTFTLLDAADRDGETVLRVLIDGTFDRTGLPDPLIMIHRLAIEGGKIARLTCRLEGEVAAAQSA